MSKIDFEEEEQNFSLDQENEGDSDIRFAISNLDFDEAERLSKKQENERKFQDDLTAENFSEYCKSIKNICKIDKEITHKKIELDVDEEIYRCVSEFRRRFEETKREKELEMECLKNEWEQAHLDAVQTGKEKVESKLFASRALATSKCYSEAKELRNKTNAMEKSIIKEEADKVDSCYKTLFEKMIKRHMMEIDSLYNEMEKSIEIIKGNGEMMKNEATENEKIDGAMSLISCYASICNSKEVSTSEKKSMIAEISPRKRRDATDKKNEGFFTPESSFQVE